MRRHGCIDEGFIQRTTHEQLHFFGATNSFCSFSSTIVVVFFRVAVFWGEEDGQRLMRYT